MEAFILSEVEQGVMTITLNRPDRLNSFNDLMHLQLATCLKQAERDDSVRCLLLTGACLLYTSPSPRDRTRSRMPSSA